MSVPTYFKSYMLTEQKRRCSDVLVLIFGKHTLIVENCSIVAKHCDFEKNRTKYHRYTSLHSKLSVDNEGK